MSRTKDSYRRNTRGNPEGLPSISAPSLRPGKRSLSQTKKRIYLHGLGRSDEGRGRLLKGRVKASRKERERASYLILRGGILRILAAEKGAIL